MTDNELLALAFEIIETVQHAGSRKLPCECCHEYYCPDCGNLENEDHDKKCSIRRFLEEYDNRGK